MTYDWFAIRIVVREGKYMPLTPSERTVAMKLLGEKGYTSPEIADIMHSNPAAVTKAWQRPWPYPRKRIPASVVGGPVEPRKPLISRDEVRRLTGI